MNERIKELAEQAEKYALSITQWDNHPKLQLIRDDKFAELIIRECVGVANNYYSPYYIGDKIKKHFGVE